MMLLSALLLALATSPTAEGKLALNGLDPVALCRGKEVAGDPKIALQRENHFIYRFASDENFNTFKDNPTRYEVQMDGACARMGPLSGICDAARFAVHEGRIYLFASDACRTAFLKDPARHLDVVEPPLPDDAAMKQRGRELVDLALEGIGGSAKVDAVRILRTEKRATREEGGKSSATREVLVWRMPDGMRRETAWDDSVYATVVTPVDNFQGSREKKSLTRAGLVEFRKNMAHEPLWLLRHRGDPGFDATAGGESKVGEARAEILRIRFESTVTDLHLDPETGRVLRVAWNGRVEPGMRGDVVVDYSDHRSVRGILLPHAQEFRFDGKVLEHLSGKLDAVEIDPEMPLGTFERGT